MRGALDLERTPHGVLAHRPPAEAHAQFTDGQLARPETRPCGAQLVFRRPGTPAERAAGKLTLDVIRDDLSRI
ncbi:hypothetical protein ACIP79_03895 [Streptomyces sp. NPDC088747]|uniref:hypothetical protein n=1 Tax=Streptomyces sp. NPDC088747 TaxID=3365886 RepID=UPI00380AB6E1